MNFVKIASILMLSVGLAQTASADVYSCRDDRGGPVTMGLAFEGKTLVKTVIKNVTYKKFPQTLTLTGTQLKKTFAQNSEEKFAHYDVDLRQVKNIDPFYQGPNVTFDFSYPYQHKGKALTLDQSLVETYESVSGTAYGKLRLDLEFDGFGESNGSTWTFFCKRTR